MTVEELALELVLTGFSNAGLHVEFRDEYLMEVEEQRHLELCSDDMNDLFSQLLALRHELRNVSWSSLSILWGLVNSPDETARRQLSSAGYDLEKLSEELLTALQQEPRHWLDFPTMSQLYSLDSNYFSFPGIWYSELEMRVFEDALSGRDAAALSTSDILDCIRNAPDCLGHKFLNSKGPFPNNSD